MDFRKKLFFLFVMAAIIGSFSFVLLRSDRTKHGSGGGWFDFKVGVGDQAPDFTFPDLDGKQVSLKDLRGKIVFLNVWATWCPPCREEMPSMESLYQKFKGHNFEMLAVSIDIKGEEVVRPFVTELGLNFTILLDLKNEITRLYGLTGVPETLVIDQDGVIILKIIGPRNWIQKEWLDYFDRVTRKTLR
jgi:peroxiredoxin